MDGLVYVVNRGPYLLFVVLAVLGVYLMAAHRNYLQALIGLYLFQVSAILLFVAVSFRVDGSIPIRVDQGPVVMSNPLPHALMLTAIVVGVATLGVAVAIMIRIQAETGSIEEPRDAGGAAGR